MKPNITTLACVVLLISKSSCAQNENTPYLKTPATNSYTLELVVPDVEIPWGMVFLPNGDLLYTEKEGKLIRFQYGKKNEISGLPSPYVRGQGGLMGIALHPDFEQNNRIYFTMATANEDASGGNTGLYTATLRGNALSDVKLLYKAVPDTKKGVHFGSRIVFDSDGYLYFSVGDRGERDINPQDITRDNGKIYRLNDDGSVPIDNPFVGVNGAKEAIYSYGLRNPQGIAINPLSNEIWIHDHGPRGGDEINIISAGKNYGWPLASYGVNYIGTKFTDNTSLKGMEDPIHYWVPSIAPSGMVFVTSDIYPRLKNNLLIGSLKFEYLHMCVLNGNKVVKEEKLLEGIGRVRSLEIGPKGFVYAGVENLGIIKLLSN